MVELLVDDLHFVVSRLPKDVATLLKSERVYVAGGFIRATIAGERVADIDVLGSDKGRLDYLAKTLAVERRGRVYETDNAFTVLSPPRIPVQFIHRWLFDNPKELVASFDFTIAQAVVWWEPDIGGDSEKGVWASLVSDRYYQDLAARRLVYLSPIRKEDAGGSLLRVRKFLKAGYSIQPRSLAKVVARLVMGIDWSKLPKGESQEESISFVLTGLLREVDPLVVVDGVDLIDEHQITGVKEGIII